MYNKGVRLTVKEKYRFNFEEIDKCCKDDLLWVFDNFIVGIGKTGEHFVTNHYSKDFDKTNYIKVELDYSIDDYDRQYMEWVFSEMEHWYL